MSQLLPSLAHRILKPPLPVYHNPSESALPHSDGVSLWIGAAGQNVPGDFIAVDIVTFTGVDVVANVEALPFSAQTISRIECDAVLEHVEHPTKAVSELFRVLRPGGYLHIVVPFCNPVHLYPGDYSRWTIDGLRELLAAFDIEDIGARTGPTATLLTILLEYLKLISPKLLRKPVYPIAGWYCGRFVILISCCCVKPMRTSWLTRYMFWLVDLKSRPPLQRGYEQTTHTVTGTSSRSGDDSKVKYIRNVALPVTGGHASPNRSSLIHVPDVRIWVRNPVLAPERHRTI